LTDELDDQPQHYGEISEQLKMNY